MGKRGNKQRKKSQRTLADAIADQIREDEIKLYGKPGVPNDNVVWLGMPPNPTQPQLLLPPPFNHEPLEDEEDPFVAGLPKHSVRIMKDHKLTYPDLCLAVYVEGPENDCYGFAQMFAQASCEKAYSPENADLVVFAGGPDVDPTLYGEEKHISTHIDLERDKRDIEVYLNCIEIGAPMLGICRGAQFLHVMQGGKLYQDVDNHGSAHQMWAVRDKMMIEKVSSVHHQMVINNVQGGMEVLGTTPGKSKNRWRNPTQNDEGNLSDIEAFFYRDPCIIGIQGHPEYSSYPFFTEWTLKLLNSLLNENPDLEYKSGKLRLKEELRVKPPELVKGKGKSKGKVTVKPADNEVMEA